MDRKKLSLKRCKQHTMSNPLLLQKLRDATDKTVPKFTFKGIECPAKVVHVYDGDTCRIVFAHPSLKNDHDLVKITVRLRDYNSPELRSSNPDEKQAAYRAKERLQDLIDGKIVHVKLGKNGKYGRTLARIYIDNGKTCVNDLMIKEGHGVPFMQQQPRRTETIEHRLDYVI